MKPYFQDDAASLYLGNCIEVLAEIPDQSVDTVVTDAPYALTDLPASKVIDALTHWLTGDRAYTPSGNGGFMGREWDKFVPPPAAWDECWRVLKPGGHLLAFAAPRTADLMTMSIRLAGFEIRDGINWIYGQGFPKGVDIAKAIDKRREDRPDVLEVTRWLAARRVEAGWAIAAIDALFGFNGMASHWCATAGKAACVPTIEQWAILRAAMGFDDSAILPVVERLNGRKGEIGEAWGQREVIAENPRATRKSEHLYGEFSGDGRITLPATGDAKRWDGWNTQLKPAHEPVVVARKSTGFNTTVANVLEWGTGALNIDACRTEVRDADYARNAAGDHGHAENRDLQMDFRQGAGRANDIGRWPTNTVFSHSGACAEDGECAPGCPVVELDAQSGVLTSGANPTRRNSAKFQGAYGEFEGDRGCVPARGADSGGASRFFPVFRYESKAPASERPRLIDGTQWPTVKPVALMRWLVRLVTPPGGVVLDPFCGSGATGEAAITEGFDCVLIERDPVAAELAKTRLSKPLQPSLFGGLDEPEAT